MTAVITKISKATEPTDPLREVLRQAIAEQANADAALEAHRAAIARAERLVEEAESKVDNAHAAIDIARTEDAAAAAQAIKATGTRATAARQTSAVRSARFVEQDALDECDVARAALARLTAELPELELAASWAATGVVAATNALLAPLAERLLQRAGAARRDFAQCEALLIEIFEGDRGVPRFPDDAVVANLRATEQRGQPLAALHRTARDFFRGGWGRDEDRAAAAAATAELRAGIERLRVDADAAVEIPLP